MSSIVENNVSSGIDFSSMPSGERRLFTGLLNGGVLATGKANSVYLVLSSGSTNTTDMMDLSYALDYSTVSSVTFTVAYTLLASSSLAGWYNINAAIGSYQYAFTSRRQVPNPSMGVFTSDTQTLDFSDIDLATLACFPEANAAIQWFITSYTTTDGKVHTANNTNY